MVRSMDIRAQTIDLECYILLLSVFQTVTKVLQKANSPLVVQASDPNWTVSDLLGLRVTPHSVASLQHLPPNYHTSQWGESASMLNCTKVLLVHKVRPAQFFLLLKCRCQNRLWLLKISFLLNDPQEFGKLSFYIITHCRVCAHMAISLRRIVHLFKYETFEKLQRT